MQTVVAIMLSIMGAYLAIGALVALAYVTLIVHRVDPAARGAHPLFRVLIFPGVAALWPALLMSAKRRCGGERRP